MKFGEFVKILQPGFYEGAKGIVTKQLTKYDYEVKLDMGQVACFDVAYLKGITFGEYTGDTYAV